MEWLFINSALLWQVKKAQVILLHWSRKGDMNWNPNFPLFSALDSELHVVIIWTYSIVHIGKTVGLQKWFPLDYVIASFLRIVFICELQYNCIIFLASFPSLHFLSYTFPSSLSNAWPLFPLIVYSDLVIRPCFCYLFFL